MLGNIRRQRAFNSLSRRATRVTGLTAISRLLSRDGCGKRRNFCPPTRRSSRWHPTFHESHSTNSCYRRLTASLDMPSPRRRNDRVSITSRRRSKRGFGAICCSRVVQNLCLHGGRARPHDGCGRRSAVLTCESLKLGARGSTYAAADQPRERLGCPAPFNKLPKYQGT